MFRTATDLVLPVTLAALLLAAGVGMAVSVPAPTPVSAAPILTR